MKKEFRAWDENQKYMAYQGTPDLESIQSFMHHFGDCELMQCIGHEDKTGLQKIFEGDIVIWQGEGFIGNFYHRCEVIFDEIEWNGWALKNLDDPELQPVPIGMHGAQYEDLEIIGHKYDKSYLLRDDSNYKFN